MAQRGGAAGNASPPQVSVAASAGKVHAVRIHVCASLLPIASTSEALRQRASQWHHKHSGDSGAAGCCNDSHLVSSTHSVVVQVPPHATCADVVRRALQLIRGPAQGAGPSAVESPDATASLTEALVRQQDVACRVRDGLALWLMTSCSPMVGDVWRSQGCVPLQPDANLQPALSSARLITTDSSGDRVRCLALCRAPPAGAPSGSQSKSTDFPPPARLCVFAPRVGSRRVLSSTAAQRVVSKDCQEGLLLSGILHRFDRSLVRAVRSGVAWCWQVQLTESPCCTGRMDDVVGCSLHAASLVCGLDSCPCH